MKHFFSLLIVLLLTACSNTQQLKIVVDDAAAKIQHEINNRPKPAPVTDPEIPTPTLPVPPPPPPVTSSVPKSAGSGGHGFPLSSSLGSSGMYQLMPRPSQRAQAILVRKILEQKTNLPSGPYSYIIFPGKPNSQEMEFKYKIICHNWISLHPESINKSQITEDTFVMPFYWFVEKISGSSSCENLINIYDYARAKVIAFRKDLDYDKIYLVYEFNSASVIMDVSSLNTTSDVWMAMSKWQKELRAIPKSSGVVRPYGFYTSARAVLGAFSMFLVFKEQ